MKLSDLSSSTSQWFNGSGPFSDVVISSRIRLARNLAGFEFLSLCSESRKAEILEKLKKNLLSLNIDKDVFYVGIDTAGDVEKDFLVERQCISRHHAHAKGPRGVVIAPAEGFAAMINEEDHLRMQVLKPGLQLQQCWEQINKIDDIIESHIDYAFSPTYGYLTACPTNIGTGIRVSVMLHLPALKIAGHLEKFFNATREMNLAVRGLFGEGTEAAGDFFQVSNQVTLGISETQIVEEFTNSIIPGIAEYEKLARQQLLKSQVEMLDDKIFRALGVLKSAHLISSQEALFLLSHLRMGVNMNRLEGISISTINELFLLTQPAHLQLNHGEKLEPDQRDTLRAQIVRTRLSQN